MNDYTFRIDLDPELRDALYTVVEALTSAGLKLENMCDEALAFNAFLTLGELADIILKGKGHYHDIMADALGIDA